MMLKTHMEFQTHKALYPEVFTPKISLSGKFYRCTKGYVKLECN